jgi:hypothetical protein
MRDPGPKKEPRGGRPRHHGGAGHLDVFLQVRMSREFRERVVEACARKGVTASDQVRDLLEQWLARNRAG